MSRKQTRTKKQIIREAERANEFGIAAHLKNEDEFFEMVGATDDYAHDGDRVALFRAFLALGIDVECARWHADNPGIACATYPGLER
jgi:hypothetical protein